MLAKLQANDYKTKQLCMPDSMWQIRTSNFKIVILDAMIMTEYYNIHKTKWFLNILESHWAPRTYRESPALVK